MNVRVFPASVGLALVLLVGLPAAGGPECEYEHTYLGNLPKEKEPGWHAQAQGIDHDHSSWYVSQLPRGLFQLPLGQVPPDKCEGPTILPTGLALYSCVQPTLWRIPLAVRLSSDVSCGDPAASPPGSTVCARLGDVAPDVWALGYNHYGDIDYHAPDAGHAYVCVPLEGKLRGGESLTGAMAFFRGDDLSFVAMAEVPELGATAAWCAIDPAGYLYSSGKRPDGKTDAVQKYHVEWSDLALPAPVATLTHAGTLPLTERDGSAVVLEPYLQGGTFSDDGRLLYLTNGTAADACADCGIQVFEVEHAETHGACGDADGDCVARRVDRSTNGYGAFNYEYHPGCCRAEEPEGLTWWDLSDPSAPPVDDETSAGQRLDASQLHALLLDNDSSVLTFHEDDDVYVKHYRVEVRCEPQAGVAVRPRVVDFGDVDLGDGATREVSISNEGDADLRIDALRIVPADVGFALSAAPGLPRLLPPAGEETLEVAFTPVAAGLARAALEVLSDDPDQPVVQVDLAGSGLSLEDQARRLLDLFDEAVADGFLRGDGPGTSAPHRLAALRAMLEEALAFVLGGHVPEACGQLEAARMHCDGERRPADLVAGVAAATLAAEIGDLRAHLGCALPGE